MTPAGRIARPHFSLGQVPEAPPHVQAKTNRSSSLLSFKKEDASFLPSWPPRPMIRMPCRDRPGTEGLFGEHGADQQVGPGHRAERQGVVGAAQDARVQAFGAADEEAEGAGGVEPACEEGGEGFAAGRGGAEVERDGQRLGRQGGEDGIALAAFDFAGAAPPFRQFGDAEGRAQPGVVAVEQRRFRPRADAADGDQAEVRQGSPGRRGFRRVPRPTFSPGRRACGRRA